MADKPNRGEEIDLNPGEEAALEAAWERLDAEGLPAANARPVASSVRILLSGDGEDALVLKDDGKLYRRQPGEPDEEALDPSQTGIVGAKPRPFDLDGFAQGGNRWGMWRVFGADGKPYPAWDGDGLPEMDFTEINGEPAFQVKGQAPAGKPAEAQPA